MITKVEGSDTRSAPALPLLYGPETERRIAAIGFAPGLFFFGVETTGVPSPLELHRRPVHRYGMEERGWIERHGFWPLALLWLPAGVAARAVVRFLMATAAPPDPGMWVAAVPMAAASLVVLAPCGLPLALGCCRLWRLGYRRGAWWIGITLGSITVAASVFAGLLGPAAIAIGALIFSLPVWGVWWWLAYNG